MAKYIQISYDLEGEPDPTPEQPYFVTLGAYLNVVEADEWAEHPDQPGTYRFVEIGYRDIEFRFSDQNVAFEFKIKFG